MTVGGNLNSNGIRALNNLPNLAVLDLESVNLETLPAISFQRKTSPTSVKLPKNLKTIGHDAFESCKGLIGELVIPESVTSIGTYAFYGCHRLTKIYCKPTVPPSV